MVQSTSLKDKFLNDYIMLRYPEKAEEYAAILQQGNMMPKLLQSSMQLLVQAVTDENGQVRPEWQAQIPRLQQLQQQAMAVLKTSMPAEQQAAGAEQTQQPQQQ